MSGGHFLVNDGYGRGQFTVSTFLGQAEGNPVSGAPLWFMLQFHALNFSALASLDEGL